MLSIGQAFGILTVAVLLAIGIEWIAERVLFKVFKVKGEWAILATLAVAWGMCLGAKVGLLNPLLSPTGAVINLWADYLLTGVVVTALSNLAHDVEKRLRK
jgi:hypothetical protein